MITWILIGFVCLCAVLLTGLVLGFDRSLDDYEHQPRQEIDMSFDPEDAA